MVNTPTRPVIRYYGGKWKIAEWIIQFFPEHNCYVEPFGGAASVLLRKKPARVEIYNDLSSEMVNLFRVLRDPEKAAQLRLQLELTPYSREEWLACYPVSSNEIEQARRTIVLASMSYNLSKVMMRQSNGFRSSSSGHHRLPQDFQNATHALQSVTARMKGVIIENKDAVSIMQQHDRRSTLHYVDPPYLSDLRADKRNRYQFEAMSVESHADLSVALKDLKGYVVLSGYPCAAYSEWYESAGWQAYSIQAVIGAATPGKSVRTEVLWLNPRAAAAQKQLQLFTT